MKSPIKYAPLSSGFMFISIIGFLLSIWLVMEWSESIGFSFALLFVLMFISSIVSMTKAEPIPEHMDMLKIHPPKSLRRGEGHHHKKIMWYEYLLLVYFAAWVFFIFMSFAGKIYLVNSILTVIFLIVTVLLIMWFIVDATSDEKLSKWEQVLFTLILVFTAGLGIFIYYIYKRIKY